MTAALSTRATSPSDLTPDQVANRNPCPVHHDFKSVEAFKTFLVEKCAFDKTLAKLLIGALAKAATAGGHGDEIHGKDVRATDFFDDLSTYFFRNGFDAKRFDDAMAQVAPKGLGPYQIAALVRALRAEQKDASTFGVIRTLFEYAAIRYASAGSAKMSVEDLRDLFTKGQFTERFQDAGVKKRTIGVIGGFLKASSFYVMQSAIYACTGKHAPATLVAPAVVGANTAIEKCPFHKPSAAA